MRMTEEDFLRNIVSVTENGPSSEGHQHQRLKSPVGGEVYVNAHFPD